MMREQRFTAQPSSRCPTQTEIFCFDVVHLVDEPATWPQSGWFNCCFKDDGKQNSLIDLLNRLNRNFQLDQLVLGS